MASREHYEINLGCKACGASGKADVSENDYMWMRSLDRNVTMTEGPFECLSEQPFKFRCTKCGTETD